MSWELPALAGLGAAAVATLVIWAALALAGRQWEETDGADSDDEDGAL